MLTRAANRGWPGDIAESDLVAAGLPAPSVVRTLKSTMIEVPDAARIGELPKDDRKLVAAAFRQNLAQARIA